MVDGTDGADTMNKEKTQNTKQSKFEKFHRENPDVYVALVKLARRIKKANHSYYSIAGLYEVARFDRFVSTNGKPYKLNNDHKSRYARLIMDTEEDLKGFFKLRALQRD
jgi:hypothetical protein